MSIKAGLEMIIKNIFQKEQASVRHTSVTWTRHFAKTSVRTTLRILQALAKLRIFGQRAFYLGEVTSQSWASVAKWSTLFQKWVQNQNLKVIFSAFNQDDFLCACTPGYHPPTCENSVCASDTCKNNGTCTVKEISAILENYFKQKKINNLRRKSKRWRNNFKIVWWKSGLRLFTRILWRVLWKWPLQLDPM